MSSQPPFYNLVGEPSDAAVLRNAVGAMVRTQPGFDAAKIINRLHGGPVGPVLAKLSNPVEEVQQIMDDLRRADGEVA